jgi:SnoaL-like protein
MRLTTGCSGLCSAAAATEGLAEQNWTRAQEFSSAERRTRMDKAFAEHFAADWIDSWNAHDLDRVLSHYADDFEMYSPVIIQITGEPSGRLCGKSSIGAYWSKALQLIPDLRFELISVLVGVDSITIYYKGAGGRLAAEVFFFVANQKVSRSVAHYSVQDAP